MSYSFNKQAITAAIRDGASKGVSKVALQLQNELAVMLQQPGGGKRSGGAKYPRSLAGQPPAKQWGFLLGSWQADITKPKVFGGRVVLRIQQDSRRVNYAAWLEYGTSRMHARPYLRPAVKKIAPKAKTIIEKEVTKALQRLKLMRAKP